MIRQIAYFTVRLLSATVLMALAACSSETDDFIPAGGQDSFMLSANQEQLITRADGLTGSTFDTGTKYRLYGIIGNDWSRKLATMNGVEGTETVASDGTHSISYLSSGTSEDRFEGRTLSFYGLTYETATAPTCTSGSDNAPLCSIQETGGALPDLRRAVLSDQTGVNSGILTLPFKHTLTRLKFEVVKQTETGTDLLKDIVLTGISVNDYSSGTLNLATGIYDHTGNLSKRSVVSGISQAVTTTVKPVTTTGADTGDEAGCLIFPTAETATEGLKVTVKTKKSASETTEDEQTYEITVPKINADGTASETEKEPFRFQPNYQYTLTITITNSDVQIITIIPRRYDWINVDDDMQYLGQPLTFNGLTWMDRNLGATSADMKTREGWEGARGYMYQLGRSIPYYFAQTKAYTGSDGKTYYRPLSFSQTGSYGNSSAKALPMVEGHKTETPQNVGARTVDYVALHPGDVGPNKTFYFVISSAGGVREWSSDGVSKTYWNKSENDPCPKGWRVPTKDDFSGIMPTATKYGDLTFLNHGGTSWIEDNANNDPETGYSSTYICIRASTSSPYGIIYAIKKKGTSEAYRLRWTIGIIDNNENIIDRGGTGYRSYLTISRYPCSKDDVLTVSNYLDYDWEHPTDKIDFPIAGYVYSENSFFGGLLNAGVESLYATSTIASNNYSICASIKYSANGNNRYLHLGTTDRTSGVSVRCVRDVTSQ